MRLQESHRLLTVSATCGCSILKILEPRSILRRIDKAENHVTEVLRIGIQRIEPILEADGVRVSPEVAKVLHRDKSSIEELVEHRLAFYHRSQNLSSCLPAV